jgi:2-iminoacetate synthase
MCGKDSEKERIKEMTKQIINEKAIQNCLLENSGEEKSSAYNILEKAKSLEGLSVEEAAVLLSIKDPALIQKLYDTAKHIKDIIYGKRLVLFAPLYISNLCSNNCLYCAFRSENKELVRRSLSQEEIIAEAKGLIDEGHKRVLLVGGEDDSQGNIKYILDSIETVYKTKSARGAVRRINVNFAPLSIDGFKELKQAQIGTYQLFQETYHRGIYSKVHMGGKKADYPWRLEGMDRAMQAGIDDVGIGVLFGLADWRFEVLALLQHAQSLEKHYGVGPHTISVPRLEPAIGSELSVRSPNAVSDEDFYKIIAVLRLAVPYTGIILSTRESPEIRRKALALGVSQISAGSRTNPGGYTDSEKNAEQFSLGDHRSLDEVVCDVCSQGYIPSFCTGCYRLGRTGEHFMKLAKPGSIKNMCEINGLTTFKEYLSDYATPETAKAGKQLIQKELSAISKDQKSLAEKLIAQVDAGERDVFV